MASKFLLLAFSLALSSCSALAIGSQASGNGESGLAITKHYALSENILAIELDPGSVDYAQQQPYAPQPGDYINDDGHDRWLERKGVAIGNWVSPVGQYNDWDDGKNGGEPGPGRALVYDFDRYQPPLGHDRFKPKRSEHPRRYRLSSSSDPAYSKPLRPQQVFRKSRPLDMARVDPWNRVYPVAHSLYFEWPHPLKPGQEYQLETTDGSIAPLSFRYEPDQAVSDAVHVSHIGFRADEPKLAFLSSWMGSGGGLEYDPNLKFQVIDQASQRSVYQGQIEVRRKAHEPEDPRGQNYNGTTVYAMAFDELDQPGDYRLCVETVGCSQSFPIGDNPWQAAFTTAARGFYYQRSGIPLEAPHSDRPRPQPFFPQGSELEGKLSKYNSAKAAPSSASHQLKVYQSQTPLLETGNGLADAADNFTELVSGKTNQIVPDAWGGYFDAADWDRRIQHLDAARLLLELNELFPQATSEINLNLPESGNGLPDVVNEALWGLDVFKRMQQEDGGIRGGIESAEHPRRGETSWQESWSVMAYAPDAWSSYVYAGVAARAAMVLEQLASPTARSLAQDYRTSAEAAMAYGEKQPSTPEQPHGVKDARNLAALELWRLTGDPQWHEVFLATTVFSEGEAIPYLWDSHDQRHAAFLYARLSPQQAQADVQANARNALLGEAEGSLALSESTGFAWTRMEPWRPMGWGGGLGNPKLTTLLRAHALTQDEKYLKTALRAGQFSVGANPLNMTFTTGVGHHSPQHPLVLDQRILGQPPAPGITVYGPLDLKFFGDEWAVEEISPQVYPNIHSWPATESYFDMYLFPAIAEFTIHETMAPIAYAWGYFAARNQPLSTTSFSQSHDVVDTPKSP